MGSDALTPGQTPTRVERAARFGLLRAPDFDRVTDLYCTRIRRAAWPEHRHAIEVDLTIPVEREGLVFSAMETRRLVESLRLAYDLPDLGLILRIEGCGVPESWVEQEGITAWINVAGRGIGGVWTYTDLRRPPWDSRAAVHASQWRGVVETSNY